MRSDGRRRLRGAIGALAGAAWLLLGGAGAVPRPGPAPVWAKGEKAKEEKRGEQERLEALRRLQGKIEREQRALGQVEGRRAGVVESLRALEQRLADQEKSLRDAEAGVAEAARSQKALEADEVRTRQDLRALETRLAARLVALYKLRDVGYFRILFSAKDYQDLARRTRFLRRIVSADAALIAAYHAKLKDARDQAAALETQRAALARLRKDADAQRAEVEARRREKLALLDRLGREKESRLAAIAELEDAARALQGTFEALRKAAPPPEIAPLPGPERGVEPSVPFSAERGHVPMPVEGRVIKRFGLHADPALGTEIRSNGITLRAHYGDPIRAVHDGRVLYAGWFRGYGRILITDHGEGFYTLVAHASELLKHVGDPVRTGEIVARVGDSGSLEGPVVYFEIRERGKPLDPMDWISR